MAVHETQATRPADADSLFRPEATHREARLEGDVLLSCPVSIWAPVLLLGLAAAAGLLAAAFGQYAVTTTLGGMVQPDIALVDLRTPAAATVQEILVAEGDDVAAGAPLLTLGRSDEGGARVLTAPAAGRIVALAASPGAPAPAGETLVAILPEGATMQAVFAASGPAATQVRPGQEVRLLYPGLSGDRDSAARGVVAAVTTSRIHLQPAPGAPVTGPERRVVVALDRQSVTVDRREVALAPGTPVSAEIVRERRSMLAWIFAPIVRALRGPPGRDASGDGDA